MDVGVLLEQHGYTLTFLGSLIEGEIVLVLAGLGAHRGYLRLPWVILLGAGGGFVAGQVLFWIGRRYGGSIFARFPRFARAHARVDDLLLRQSRLAVGAVRVMYGLRILGPLAIGMSPISARTFALSNAIASLLWSAAWTIAGFTVGEALTRTIEHFKRFERPVFIAVAIGATLVLIAIKLRPRSVHRS
jgi:membrane protein DedA with SNARE-associated domain